MAKFVINSTNTKAIRKSDVVGVEIRSIDNSIPPVPPSISYELSLTMSTGHFFTGTFETDTTLEGIQAKAITILSALEAE